MLLGLIQILAFAGFISLILAWRASNDMLAIVSGLMGGFAWGLAAYGLFNVETVQGTGTYSEPGLALFAAACAFASIVPAFVNPFEQVTDAGEGSDPLDRI